jgi:23S rRNA pseudouridine1911/1915/1917 synthase
VDGAVPEDRDNPLILPGGKVDPVAIRALYKQLRDAKEASQDDSADASVDGAGHEPGEDDTLPEVTFVLQRDRQSRLDKYLTTRITFMSRTQIQRLIDGGSVLVNGAVGKASTKLRLGDEVRVTLPPPPSDEVVPEDIPLDVLAEDEHLVVINKHAGIIVHPARSENRGTMINALSYHFQHRTGGGLSKVGREFARPGVVHRLDRDTTGCIVFAKTEEAHWKIAAQFEKRTTDKRYLAIVAGHVEPAVQVIDLPLGPHPSRSKGTREKQVVRHDHLGKASVTICRVRERYRLHRRAVGDQHFTLVELELKTGRTHQIRVHLSHSGWPIVGDDLYGGRGFEMPGTGGNGPSVIERQMLHAALLCFDHPTTGELTVASAPPPADMRSLIAHLRSEGEPVAVDAPQSVPLPRFGL